MKKSIDVTYIHVPSTEDDAADADTPEQVQLMNRMTGNQFLKLRVSIFVWFCLRKKNCSEKKQKQNVRISPKKFRKFSSSGELIRIFTHFGTARVLKKKVKKKNSLTIMQIIGPHLHKFG